MEPLLYLQMLGLLPGMQVDLAPATSLNTLLPGPVVGVSGSEELLLYHGRVRLEPGHRAASGPTDRQQACYQRHQQAWVFLGPLLEILCGSKGLEPSSQGGQGCFQVRGWDHITANRCSTWAGTASSVLFPLGFHNLLPGSQGPEKGTFVYGWLPSCCFYEGMNAGDVLFCYLAGINSYM